MEAKFYHVKEGHAEVVSLSRALDLSQNPSFDENRNEVLCYANDVFEALALAALWDSEMIGHDNVESAWGKVTCLHYDSIGGGK